MLFTGDDDYLTAPEAFQTFLGFTTLLHHQSEPEAMYSITVFWISWTPTEGVNLAGPAASQTAPRAPSAKEGGWHGK
jgi:hypothetical protein